MTFTLGATRALGRHLGLGLGMRLGLTLLVATIPVGAIGQTSAAKGCIYTLASGAQPQCAAAGLGDTAMASVSAAAPQSAVSVAVAAPSPPPPPDHPRWELRLQDVTLAAAFTRWAQVAAWRVLWDVDKHLLIDSPDVYLGSFEQVVSAVLSSPGLVYSQYPLEVCFYPNTPPLARITRRGEQKLDCK